MKLYLILLFISIGSSEEYVGVPYHLKSLIFPPKFAVQTCSCKTHAKPLSNKTKMTFEHLPPTSLDGHPSTLTCQRDSCLHLKLHFDVLTLITDA